VVLIIDETDGRDGKLRSLRILAAFKHRCLPVLGLAYHPKRPPKPMDQLLIDQLTLVQRWLEGYDLKITLLADRGLAWPALVRFCRKHGWHYVLRLQAQTKLRSAGGTEEYAVRE